MMKIIDPHLHLFDLEQGDFHWLKPSHAPFWPDKEKINRNFSESDLELPSPFALTGFVHIEAGFDNQQPWREIQWLESHCTLPFKSIAGIDLQLTPLKFSKMIEQLKVFDSVIGVRDILDENAVTYLSNPQVQSNLALLAKQQLIFELQMPIDNSVSVNLLADILCQNPSLLIVINHAGWPPQQGSDATEAEHEHQHQHEVQQWKEGIQLLSQFEQCTIKCSGYEMTDRNYSVQWQQRTIKQCIEAFGVNRVMLASNFPLCTFHSSYQKFWQQQLTSTELSTDEPPSVQQSFVELSTHDLAKLCHHNAKRIYRF
jgi:predicted TIM-barrel fold metal-dependent hydrolase